MLKSRAWGNGESLDREWNVKDDKSQKEPGSLAASAGWKRTTYISLASLSLSWCSPRGEQTE